MVCLWLQLQNNIIPILLDDMGCHPPFDLSALVKDIKSGLVVDRPFILIVPT